MVPEIKSTLYILNVFMVSLLRRQASGKKRRKDARLGLHLKIFIEGRLLTVHYSSVHVYKVRLIANFCNVFFLQVKSIFDADKGTSCSAISFHGLRKEELIVQEHSSEIL